MRKNHINPRKSASKKKKKKTKHHNADKRWSLKITQNN